jgi:hypothetical protein
LRTELDRNKVVSVETSIDAAIGASRKEPPSASSTLLARLIVNEAKQQRPNDAAIQSIDLEENIPDWNEISAAMNVIVKTLS